jgi:hypothetical protein
MNRWTLFIPVLLLAGACRPAAPTAAELIGRCIEAHGGAAYGSLDLRFAFRDRRYRILRQEGLFRYERSWQDSTGEIRDILSNSGFRREIDGREAPLPDSAAAKYSASVNSVCYFALLPAPLADAAVQAAYAGEARIKGQRYHKLRVTFRPEGGGTDFEDEFYYWIHPETYTLEYLAYSYHTEEGGLRFREAIGAQQAGGIRLQDYVNYAADPAQWKVQDLDRAFEEGALKRLSEIRIEAPEAVPVRGMPI